MSEIQETKKLKVTDTLVAIISVAMFLFHMYTASFGILPAYAQSAIHWGFVGCYILLTRPLKGKLGKVLDAVLFAANIFLSYYQIVIQNKFVQSAGVYSEFEVILSIVAIAVAIMIAWRAIGSILPIISLVFIAYALLGSHIPGMLGTTKFTLQRIAPYLYTASEGIYGQTLYVSAQFIFLFVVFGSVLELTGAGEFFVDLAFSLVGKARGGPAQAAVYSSMLMGTISGSGAANVVTTGTFTIPLMKKSGYSPKMSGAISAVASNGGQIMPPVMGAVAFLMSEMTGIAYGTIALSALIPSVLYYATLSISVYLMARKDNIGKVADAEIKDFRVVFKEGWLYLTPLIFLVVLLARGSSAQKAAFYAILFTFVIGFIKNREKMTLKNIVDTLKGAAGGIASIAAACLLAGIVMGIINITGLGLKISGIIQVLAGGRLLVALTLAMMISLILGMGLPTSASYMILAVLVAPAIVQMGASPLAAHLFILYFGALSTITPPVALSTFAAAGIAGAGMWETGFEAIKLASTAFIIPFIWVFNEELLGIGTAATISFAVITAFIGCGVLAMVLIGWGGTKLSIPARLLLFVFSICLFFPRPVWLNAVGLFGTIAVLFVEHKRQGTRRLKESN